jgi:hypothetical protein
MMGAAEVFWDWKLRGNEDCGIEFACSYCYSLNSDMQWTVLEGYTTIDVLVESMNKHIHAEGKK